MENRRKKVPPEKPFKTESAHIVAFSMNPVQPLSTANSTVTMFVVSFKYISLERTFEQMNYFHGSV